MSTVPPLRHFDALAEPDPTLRDAALNRSSARYWLSRAGKNDLRLLLLLADRGGRMRIDQRGIADATGVSATTVQAMVDRSSAAGWVEVRDPGQSGQDSRPGHYHLTDSGRAAVASSPAAHLVGAVPYGTPYRGLLTPIRFLGTTYAARSCTNCVPASLAWTHPCGARVPTAWTAY